MHDDNPDNTPWPLWASRAYSRDELLDLLGISVRTLRSAVKRGDVEMVQEERYHAASYRLRDCAWSRKYLSRIAPPPVQSAHGATGCSAGAIPEKESNSKALNRCNVGADALHHPQKTAPTREADEVRQEVRQLTEKLEALSVQMQAEQEASTRLEEEMRMLREQLAALIALLAVLVEAQRQAEQRQHLHPITRALLAVWSWLKVQLEKIRG